MTKTRGQINRCLGRGAPFPVVLVSTKDNLITAAMVHYFSFEPQTIGVGIHRARHSFELIRREGAFVVNLLTAGQVALAEAAGNLSGRDCDKFAKLGLTKVPAAEVASSLVAECPVNIECRLVREIDLGERVWFLGEVAAVHESPGYDAGQCLVYANSTYYAVGEKVGTRHGR